MLVHPGNNWAKELEVLDKREIELRRVIWSQRLVVSKLFLTNSELFDVFGMKSMSPQAILSPPIIDRCSFSLIQLFNPRSYTSPFHQYCNVFPSAQRNNHIVVLTPRCRGLFQILLGSSGSEYPVAFRTSWSQVSRWCVEIVGGYWVVFSQVFELRTASSHCRGLQLSGSLPFKLKMVMHSSSMIKLGMIWKVAFFRSVGSICGIAIPLSCRYTVFAYIYTVYIYTYIDKAMK